MFEIFFYFFNKNDLFPHRLWATFSPPSLEMLLSRISLPCPREIQLPQSSGPQHPSIFSGPEMNHQSFPFYLQPPRSLTDNVLRQSCPFSVMNIVNKTSSASLTLFMSCLLWGSVSSSSPFHSTSQIPSHQHSHASSVGFSSNSSLLPISSNTLFVQNYCR